MDLKIADSWVQVLHDEFDKDYFKNLVEYVQQEYKEYKCFPPMANIFSALNHTDFEDVKVVILGQDPYHGLDQANGLCFSVIDGVAKPPSLQNIFKEIQIDIGSEIPQSGNLERWADQGVLLLNATLTVRAHEAGSHQNKGWEKFTDKVIELISNKREGIVFLLWGSQAKKKGAKIDANKHLVLQSGHPSPLSANRGYWFENKHFSKANAYLKSKKIEEIVW